MIFEKDSIFFANFMSYNLQQKQRLVYKQKHPYQNWTKVDQKMVQKPTLSTALHNEIKLGIH